MNTGAIKNQKLRRDILTLHYKIANADTLKPVSRQKVGDLISMDWNGDELCSVIQFLEGKGFLQVSTNVEDQITVSGVEEVEADFPNLGGQEYLKYQELRIIKLAQAITEAQRLAKNRLLKEHESTELEAEVKKLIEENLVPDSDLAREYEREIRQTRWRTVSRDGFVTDIGSLIFWRDFLLKVLASIGGKVELEQTVVPAGEFFTARTALRQILGNASSTISIFDEYLDDQEVLNIVEPYSASGVSVKLLKNSPKASFRSDVAAFKKQYGNIELAEYVTKCHDRFIILDGTTVYQLGASLKDFGGKVAAINKLNDQEANKLITMFDGWWVKAKVLV